MRWETSGAKGFQLSVKNSVKTSASTDFEVGALYTAVCRSHMVVQLLSTSVKRDVVLLYCCICPLVSILACIGWRGSLTS